MGICSYVADRRQSRLGLGYSYVQDCFLWPLECHSCLSEWMTHSCSLPGWWIQLLSSYASRSQLLQAVEAGGLPAAHQGCVLPPWARFRSPLVLSWPNSPERDSASPVLGFLCWVYPSSSYSIYLPC
jgi:hypothetical protein